MGYTSEYANGELSKAAGAKASKPAKKFVKGAIKGAKEYEERRSKWEGGSKGARRAEYKKKAMMAAGREAMKK